MSKIDLYVENIHSTFGKQALLIRAWLHPARNNIIQRDDITFVRDARAYTIYHDCYIKLWRHGARKMHGVIFTYYD